MTEKSKNLLKGSSPLRIGVDLMGSERVPQEYFDAILQMAEHLVVIATQDVIDQLPKTIKSHVASEVIAMDDDPLIAVRRKRNSSLVVGVNLLKEGKIDAFVSAGNTGALITSCTLTLPLFPGFNRPALLAMLPRKEGSFVVLDVGGHVSFKPEHLVQYAWMGAAFQRITQGVERPTIGLLNIGQEMEKGTKEMREAYALLSEKCALHTCEFVGNVEGRDVFESKLDVLVTDGFTGNVFLKTVEGLSSYIMDYLPKDQVESFKHQFNYTNYPGAIVCGVDGLVIKCHGSTSKHGMLSSLQAAASIVSQGVVKKMREELIK